MNTSYFFIVNKQEIFEQFFEKVIHESGILCIFPIDMIDQGVQSNDLCDWSFQRDNTEEVLQKKRMHAHDISFSSLLHNRAVQETTMALGGR